jgi:heptosyltransferase-2
MAITDCRHFSGYKPCSKNDSCDSQCPFMERPQTYLLIVHLGALGAVVRSTSLLRAMKRKYPRSHITWVTDAPAHHLIKNHPGVDRVLTSQESDLLSLRVLQFDVAFVIDKSLKAVAIAQSVQVEQVFGFQAQPRGGAIIPATSAADELWQLGLSNQKKFFVNTKPETQLMIEALELGAYQRDDYWLPLSASEQVVVEKRRQEILAQNKKNWILGFNTGCSPVIAYKKLTIGQHRDLIRRAHLQFPEAEIVLLGGPEDTERNIEIARGLPVTQTATTLGLRDGLISVACCDVVVTGDSLGMHMAISQKKQVIAWFGPTCAQEIDLYDRGLAVMTSASCAPCWKRSCEKDKMCYDQVSLEEILNAIESRRPDRLSRRSTALNSTLEGVS